MAFVKSMIKIGFIVSLFMVLIITGVVYYNSIATEDGDNGNGPITPKDVNNTGDDNGYEIELELKNTEETSYGFEMKAYSINGNPINSQDIEQKLLTKINNYRDSKDLNKLQEVKELKREARLHSKDMAKRDFYSHTNPDGEKPGERLEGIPYCDAYSENIHKLFLGTPLELYNNGENVIITDQDKLVEYLVEDWQASPEHNKNLINSDVKYSGIGVYLEEDDGVLIAHVTHNMCG